MNVNKKKHTNRLTLLLLSIILIHSAIANVSIPGENYIDLSAIKATYKEKNYQKVLHDGETQLANYPSDIDVQLYMGLSYYQLKQYAQAEQSFISVLNANPKYKDATTGLVRTYLAQKKYTESKTTLNNALAFYPKDQELGAYLTKVNLLVKQKNHLSKNKAPRPEVVNKKLTHDHDAQRKAPFQFSAVAKPAEVKSISDVPHYELVAMTSNATVTSTVDKTAHIWDWSGVTLYRKNEYGAFGAGLNYANRQGVGAPQLYLNAQPNLNKFVWLDLTYAQASKPNIFPNNTVVGELYGLIGNQIEASIGEGYRKIQHTYFNTITGSIAKYIAHYSFTFRPNHFVPKSGPTSTLYTFRARRYSPNNPDQYLGLVLASGTSPDLFDLLTVAFFNIKNNIILIEGQQPIKDTLLFMYGGGYETQKFPNSFVRRLAYGNIGLKLRFE
jgi:YaiO family outer membrane protein